MNAQTVRGVGVTFSPCSHDSLTRVPPLRLTTVRIPARTAACRLPFPIPSCT